ncbi:MAG: TonB-dependent receptor [Negativicutes bacterium]
MKKKKLAINILLGVVLATTPVYASDIPSFAMEEIVISAEAVQPALQKDMVNVIVVNPGKASNVPDLLRQMAGIDVQLRTASGDNQDGTVKLRGFDAKRFTVLIDGRPAGMSGVMGGNYIDWNTISLDEVEKIQIIKGAKSAAYGNTMGGVVNIITKKNLKEGASGTATVMAGENGRQQYLFNYGGKTEKVSWRVLYNKYGEDAFLLNNDYNGKQYGAEFGYDITDKDELKVRYNQTKAKRGYIIGNDEGLSWYDPDYPVISSTDRESLVPSITGYSSPLRPGANWEKDFKGYDFSWKHKFTNGSLSLLYWKNDEKRREVNYTVDGAVELDRTIPSDRSSGWQLNGEYNRGGHDYTYGLDYRQMRYGYGWYTVLPSGVDPNSIYPSQKMNLFGVYVDDSWKLTSRWSGNVGLRYDSMQGRRDDERAINVPNKDYNGLSPKLNFSFRNNSETMTFLSLNRLWRAPSMAEYYWWKMMPSNPMKKGTNLDLKPEQGWEYEIGVSRHVSDKFTTKLSVYYQDVENYINFTHQYPFSVYNIDQAKLWGVEWQNTYKVDERSSLSLNYTNQHTMKDGVLGGDNLGLSGELDYRPRHKLSLGYQYDIYPWQLRYTMDYTGRQTANYPYGSTSMVSIGGYVVHNLAVTRELQKDRLVTLSVNNLFDKNYVEQYNYPMSGRWFSVSLQQKL